MISRNLTVAIITSTIGRKELSRAIESVKAQTYPCKHYIFVDGEQFADKVKEIVSPYQDLIITYLPMNTGKNGQANATIHAIATFLVEEDIICYLDDDNWYEPEHVEHHVQVLSKGADFSYSLRNFYTQDERFICPDDFESLGYWKMEEAASVDIKRQGELVSTIKFNAPKYCMIDANTYAFSRKLALRLTKSWYQGGYYGDREVYKKLEALNLKGKSTGKYTVNYLVDLNKMFKINSKNEELNKILAIPSVKENILKSLCQMNIEQHNNTKPWTK